jgi:transcription elongation factor Elf1
MKMKKHKTTDKELHKIRKRLAIEYENLIACKKCSSYLFVVKKIKKIKSDFYCDLICSNCGKKLNLMKWKGQEIKLIRKRKNGK